MDRRAQAIIAVLGVAVAFLTVALVVVMTSGGSMFGVRGMGAMGGNNATMQMMQAMGNMDSDAMLTHMREVLGEDGYQRMLKHMQEHRAGGPMTGNPAMDSMMHQMMDGMWQQMPDDRGGMMPRATATPTPAR